MRSAFLMVLRRWAITKLVRLDVRASMARCVISSVRVSTLLVASSSISMGLSWIMALAMVSSCFCPAEMAMDSSSTVSKPLGKVSMKW